MYDLLNSLHQRTCIVKEVEFPYLGQILAANTHTCVAPHTPMSPPTGLSLTRPLTIKAAPPLHPHYMF